MAMDERQVQGKQEKRYATRRETMRLAKVILEDGERLPCVIRDLSLSGAKLSVARRHSLPKQFVLSMTDRDLTVPVRMALACPRSVAHVRS
ncbi:PilZ domain-containing protein [Methylobacterium sp. J-090]|uniref:PilZ domain-containing protein n=1 Tax=Methylobacterium sp. J-090 TaxID=2836666 RepID=UPI003919B2D5